MYVFLYEEKISSKAYNSVTPCPMSLNYVSYTSTIHSGHAWEVSLGYLENCKNILSNKVPTICNRPTVQPTNSMAMHVVTCFVYGHIKTNSQFADPIIYLHNNRCYIKHFHVPFRWKCACVTKSNFKVQKCFNISQATRITFLMFVTATKNNCLNKTTKA